MFKPKNEKIDLTDYINFAVGWQNLLNISILFLIISKKLLTHEQG
jgi:hypothetical protein